MIPALQLYSMREHADQIKLLAELPTLGITTIEGYGGVYGDPAGYRAAMDANGISMPSGHFALEDIEGDIADILQLCKTFGITRAFAPYLAEPARPTTSAGYEDLAKRLNAAVKPFADQGISFGWHNHDFEFFTLADGGVPMDILLTQAPDITWEADLAWIVRGGCDPLEYINRFGSRMASVHVKDIAAAGENLDEDRWADLGAGTMDWATLLQACRSASSDLIYALEHDKPRDPLGYARKSAAAFKTLWENGHD